MKKAKLIRNVLLTLLLLLIAAAVYFFQFTADGYLISIPFRHSFEEIGEHVYINRSYSGDRSEPEALISQAQERVRAFYGDLCYADCTYLIICDDPELKPKLGEGKETNSLRYPFQKHMTNYIYISDEYLNLDIVSHELTHAELHTRLTLDALEKLPTWFDEGIATQNDYREQYNLAAWTEQTDSGKNALAPEEMDTPAEFYAGTADDKRFRYLNAKHIVGEWMDAHSRDGLLKLIEQLNGGADFAAAFGE